MKRMYTLKIFRGTADKQYWEEFELEFSQGDNIISALMDIQRNPVNKKGEKTTPVSWEQGCLEEVCGSCSMLVNGKPRQACTALIETYITTKNNATITLAPFSKFPLVRDLVVDRTRMFEHLKKVRAWVEIDGTYEKGEGPKVKPEVQQALYELSTCMTCGCCAESCPQVNDNSEFVGPAPISQVRLFNAHPTGNMKKSDRLRPLLQKGGVADCGNAQNCAKVCPKEIPLTESIAIIGRETTKQAFKDFFSLPDAKKD